MRSNKMKFIITVSALILSTLTQAATLNCTGRVAEIQTLKSGIVRLVTSGSGLSNKSYICSVNATWKGISENTCKTWISYAQVALASNKPINVTYVTDQYGACSQLPINSVSIAPYLVSIKNQ